jgi:hypothetical protein
MKNVASEKSAYKINATYRKALFGAVISRDHDTWTWTGHIDFEDGPYRKFASRRSFATGPEAEENVRRFAQEQIDNWFIGTQPGSL